MIRSGWRSALPRRLVLVAVALLIPVLAGCEANNNAPSLQFHYPTDTAGYPPDSAGSSATGSLSIRNVFVLGAPVGRNLVKGQSASLFLAVINDGAPDKLISISAPGSATAVSLPTGGVPVVYGHPVLPDRSEAPARPRRPDADDPQRILAPAKPDVPEGRDHLPRGTGHAARRAVRDVRATAADPDRVRLAVGYPYPNGDAEEPRITPIADAVDVTIGLA